MPRRKKTTEKIDDPIERARIKKLRAIARREERKKRRQEEGGGERRSRQETPDYSKPMVKDDYEWIRRSSAMSYAHKIVNHCKERPYWLSIPFEGGNPPVGHFFPCTYRQHEGRMYYGYLFSECRDEMARLWRDEHGARREFTGPNNGPMFR